MSTHNKINIAVVGATGYTGLDLVLLLSKHPKVNIKYLCATKNLGKSINVFDQRIKKKLPKISSVKKINYKDLEKANTWIYSAGFNINKNDRNLSRIKEEIFDLKNLLRKNSRIFLLTHQGDFKKKTPKHLFFLKKILEKIIKIKIVYYSGKITMKNMQILSKKIKHKNFLFSNGIDFVYEFFHLESKFQNSMFSKTVQLLGKNKNINKFFTNFADNGMSI